MSGDAMRLTDALRVAGGAAARLEDSTARDDALLARAIDGDDTDRDVLRAVDAFVQRFQQLYEHLARRLLPAIYRVEQLGERPPPLLQLLNWAEANDLIVSARGWATIAEARNRLVHEYPLDPADRRQALAAAVQHADALLDDFAIMRRFVADHRNMERSDD